MYLTYRVCCRFRKESIWVLNPAQSLPVEIVAAPGNIASPTVGHHSEAARRIRSLVHVHRILVILDTVVAPLQTIR